MGEDHMTAHTEVCAKLDAQRNPPHDLMPWRGET